MEKWSQPQLLALEDNDVTGVLSDYNASNFRVLAHLLALLEPCTHSAVPLIVSERNIKCGRLQPLSLSPSGQQ